MGLQEQHNGKVYLLNYADDRFGHKSGEFRKNQAILNETALRQGIRNIASWTWEDFRRTEFYENHKEYLDKPYFENGFVFKPYIILTLLEQINYGDVILYCDCGPQLIDRPLNDCVTLCRRNKGTLFHQVGDKNSKQTKRDCFVYMGCDDPKYYNAVGIQATWFMLEKTDFVTAFVKEWLTYNLDERIASYRLPNTCGLPDLPDFIENRGDQSILSLLVAKYNIRTFYGAGGTANRRIGMFVRTLSWRGRIVSWLMQLSTKCFGGRGHWRLVKLVEKL